jgi:hypothetical protein
MTQLRRLRALILPKGKEKRDPGPTPSPILLKTSQLRINDEYQRQLSRDSSRLASKIALEFDWELFHMPVVSPIGETDETTGLPLYEILDGQHTSIAALTNGHIRELWCWPGRVGETKESRASSFVKLNNQRTSVTPVENFWAMVASKDEDALEVVEGCQRAEASVIKRPKPYGDMRVGETICVGALLELASQGGRPYVQRIMSLAVELRLPGVSQLWIKALTELTLKPNSPLALKGAPATVDLQIINAVGRGGVKDLEVASKMAHAREAGNQREAQFWHLASFIKQEINKHA